MSRETETTLRCIACGATLPERTLLVRCEHCGGLLEILHPPPRDREAELQRRLDGDPVPSGSGVWRFGELILPSAAGDALVTYPEGNTPLVERPALSAWADLRRLAFKVEGLNPTGSFKDRGMTVAMTHARRLGARAVACASTGNTAASMAAYAAIAGLSAFVVLPAGQVSAGKLAQSHGYGARVIAVDGDFDDCLRCLEQVAREMGIYLVNSINPFRIEGQKTIILELLRDRGWRAPDWIVCPAGNLGNTAAFGKALEEAHAWGLIDRVPRLAAVQAAGAAPFATGFAEGFAQRHAVRPDTVATAIRIGAPASWDRAVTAIRATRGVVLAVPDEAILEAKHRIDRAGIGCEPASAASLAGIRALRAAGTIRREDDVVAILTGHMLKDIAQIARPEERLPIPPTIEALHAAVREGLGS